VYYIRAGDFEDDPLPKAGKLQFYDPRGSINMLQHPGKSRYGGTMTVTPQNGLLVVFPAWLYHSVNPFLSDIERISIAFNARIVQFEELDSEKGEDASKKPRAKKAPRKKAAKKKATRKKTSGKKNNSKKTRTKKAKVRKRTALK